MNKWIQRSEIITGPKYKKGACENCGSLAHQKKQCLERPRKVKAKYSNSNIVTEVAPSVENKKVENKPNFLDKQPVYNNKYDESRDQWGSQDLTKYEQVVEEYTFEQDIKKQMGLDDTNKECVDELEVDNTNPNMDTRARTTHSFRDRSQIPKYLADFVKDHENDKKVEFNESYMRYTGDSAKFLDQERFALDNDQINSVALPTATEMMFKKEMNKKSNKDKEIKNAIEDVYGKVEGFQEKVEEIFEENLINYEQQPNGSSENEDTNENDEIAEKSDRHKKIKKSKD